MLKECLGDSWTKEPDGKGTVVRAPRVQYWDGLHIITWAALAQSI
jgi:hypothetical protein